MGSLSNLGLLWQRAHTGLENYTTAALELAIRQDARPIIDALRLVGQSGWGFLNDVVEVDPATQVPLKPGAVPEVIGTRFLDLTLKLQGKAGATQTIWVEVKIDSPESGDQIEAYELHRQVEGALRTDEPSPPLLLLSKWRLAPRRTLREPRGQPIDIAWLSWAQLVDAVRADSGSRWHDLRAFLAEHRVVSRPEGDREPPEGRAAIIEALVMFNRNMRSVASPARPYLWWQFDQGVRGNAESNWRSDRELVVTGGPLTYGLVEGLEGWQWVVRIVANQGALRHSPAGILAIADQTGLDWDRSADPRWVLQARMPPEQIRGADTILTWLAACVEELKARDVLRRLLPPAAFIP